MIIGSRLTVPTVLKQRIANSIHKFGTVDIFIAHDNKIICVEVGFLGNGADFVGRYTAKCPIKYIIEDIMHVLEG